MLPVINRQVILASYADGVPRASNFTFSESELRRCEPGHVIVRNHYLSIDPAQKGWMSRAVNYASARLGEPMMALAVGQIVESALGEYSVGEYVTGWFGWQEYAHVAPSAIQRKVDPALAPLRYAISVLGLNGLTAYIVLTDLLRPKGGETLLVSTAAGAVGSIVGQLAKQRGCRTVGLTGSDEKAAMCTREYGYDTAINYKSEDWLARLAKACPHGVDKYFDMAGGWISDELIHLMNRLGVHAQVGTAAVAAWDPWPTAPRRERVVLVKELSQHGFVVFNHGHRFAEATESLVDLIRRDRLRFHEDMHDGLQHAPAALEGLYNGTNMGKSLIRLLNDVLEPTTSDSHFTTANNNQR